MSLPKQLFAAALAFVLSATASSPGPLTFRITLSAESAPEGAQGRLIVFMAAGAPKRDVLTTGFIPGSVGVAAAEIDLAPGETCDLRPDENAFPHPFSQYKPGNYQMMALLDRDHNYPYTGMNSGDIYSAVAAQELNPAASEPVALTLSRVEPKRSQFADTESVKLAEFESPLLSAFWGRPIVMRAGVVLPPIDPKAPAKSFPAVYHVHGFGGDYSEAWYAGPPLVAAIRSGTRAAMAHVFLDGSFPTGHQEFADSVNNGPWGQALVTEFVPWLEKRYHLEADPGARFLTGHSSGGWSTLWLQITYPDFFGGTWSTAPDPVDMRSFTGVDVTQGSKENVYRKPDGTLRYLVRENGRNTVTLEDFVRYEDVLGTYGGQFASFEYVFSPRGDDGRPMKLFNRKTGRQDPLVQQHWRKYDIRATLAANWKTLGPKLRGKIHVVCGAEDTFHLDESVSMLCTFLKESGSDAVCELVPGRDHMNLYQASPTYPKGLDERIDREMSQAYHPARKSTR